MLDFDVEGMIRSRQSCLYSSCGTAFSGKERSLVMKRIFKVLSVVFLSIFLISCGALVSDDGGVTEPISNFEMQRYRELYYLKMSPGQRDYYESLPTRAARDEFLRDLGLLREKRRRKRR